MLADEISPPDEGPLDDLYPYHLNRLAGAASMGWGSGFVTLTTRAVSSGTSWSVAEVASEERLGELEG
jgi:hypothetical protein